jgi:antirestriction protein ArdC
MTEGHGDLEHHFEKALIEVLAHEYDLDVRHPDDCLDRRRQGVATLSFAYRHAADGETAKVVVTVDSAKSFSAVLPLDLRSRRAIERSAENCETLVRFLRDHLAESREMALEEEAQGRLKYGRRDDDLA